MLKVLEDRSQSVSYYSSVHYVVTGPHVLRGAFRGEHLVAV